MQAVTSDVQSVIDGALDYRNYVLESLRDVGRCFPLWAGYNNVRNNVCLDLINYLVRTINSSLLSIIMYCKIYLQLCYSQMCLLSHGHKHSYISYADFQLLAVPYQCVQEVLADTLRVGPCSLPLYRMPTGTLWGGVPSGWSCFSFLWSSWL